jgi:hypothetical protein
MEVTDTAGNMVSAVELKNKIQEFKRRLKKKYADISDDDLEVLAQVKLESAGLYPSDKDACSPCETEFYSLKEPQQKWTFNITARGGGEQTFNLTMFVKGRVRDTDNEIKAEKVWEKADLKLNVQSPILTRNRIIFSSGFLCFFGVVFAVRGIKFGNIKVLVAGGNIAGGDIVGGR